MKPGEFKRILFVFCLCSILFFIYLYWQQSESITSSRLVYTYKRAYTRPNRRVHPPQWTWQCVNQRCERRHHVPSAPSSAAVSLDTCSMLCGSTQLWPQPTGPVTLASRAVALDPRLVALRAETVAEPALGLLRLAFAAFNDTVTSLGAAAGGGGVAALAVAVAVARPEVAALTLDTDERYSLTVMTRGDEVVANVTAGTFFGARHALETLSQLMWWDEYEWPGGALKVLRGASVQDGPRFPYRGIMVDTARNYMSLDSLKRVLVGMSANKLNIFHWHVTDSQSFPLVSRRVPQLSRTGAYGPDMTYTPEEVRDLVQFGVAHGVRVLLEVDTPAHAGNGWTWGPQEGLGDLAVCVNERPWSLYCGEPPCGQLNPDNPNVYDVLEKLYRDMLEMSGEREIFHLGGDEVNLECWAQHLQKTTTLTNFTDLHDLWGEFTVKALKRLEAANGGKKMPLVIVWSSNLSKRPYIGKYLDKKNVAVQSWGSSQWPDTQDLVSDGYRVVVSHVDAWYLDCGFGRWRETGEAACDPYRPWQTVYGHRPWRHLPAGSVLGGEACLWSEQSDEGALDRRLWPRGAALAERLWTDAEAEEGAPLSEDVYTRLSTQRERMVARGVGAEAMWPEWCGQNPGMCL